MRMRVNLLSFFTNLLKMSLNVDLQAKCSRNMADQGR